MAERNPYAISFGRIPTRYINRSYLINSIITALESDPVDEQAFKLTGIRGTGKTVTLTAIEKEMRGRKNWIVAGVKSNSDITRDLVADLYSSVPFITSFINAELNLSAFGIGLNLSAKSPVASLDFALKKILTEIKKRGCRVLVTIDEARKTPALTDFVQEFQLLIREDLPVYLIAAGLYEDIESLENADGLTFFLRAEKYEMAPLNLNFIAADYEKTLGVSGEVAHEMAELTRGYAFAYQALGKYMWDTGSDQISDEVLLLLDEALADKVYNKIWRELAPRDRWFLRFIVRKETMQASELLEITRKKHNEWSEPRRRLSAKGIIDVRTRGLIITRLPRFREFIERQI